MVKIKFSTMIVLLTFLILTACTTGNGTPTPTIVPLDGSATVQSRSSLDDAPPTATRLPLPSPTPTLTPRPIMPPNSVAITPTPQISTVQPQAEVIVAALNVRQGPGVAYSVIEVAQAGDVFDVVGVDTSGDWLKVVISDENFGWISGQNPYTRLLGTGLDNVPVVLSSLPLSSSSAEVAGVSISTGNSGKLIFMTGSGGELYAVNVDGSDLRRLAGGVIDPVVSPDGRQVAFTRWDGAEFGVLYTINVDGSGERVIMGDTRQPKSPTWSPDGRQIILSFQYGGLRDPEKICNYYSPGTFSGFSKRVVIKSFRISGDGSINVCFIPFEDLHWRLRQVDVSTGTFEDLSSDEYSYNPTWDPQNPWRVVYDGDWGLVQLDITNGQRWFITEDLRDTGPVFSPDGQKLALTYKQHDHWEVYTLDLKTGVRQRLTKPPILADPQYNSAAPAWSPDGSQIAFVTDLTGQWEIWVMNVDGSNQQPLFAPEIQARLGLEYRGFNERMLSWID